MNIKTQIKQYLAQDILFSDRGFGYDDDASFLEQGILDSIGFMELVGYVEKAFGIKVGPEEVVPENFDSVNKLARYISTKQASVQYPVQPFIPHPVGPRLQSRVAP